MRSLLKYAFVLALAIAIGYIVLGPPSPDDDIVPGAQRGATAADVEPAASAPPGSIDEEVAKQLALETTKAERRVLADMPPAPGNPEATASSDARAVGKTALPALPAPQDPALGTAAAGGSTDPSEDAKPVNDSAASAAPVEGTAVTAGTQLAALAPDKICQRDGERLEQLRGHPSSDDLVHFANELGCKKLLPQIVSLMKSLAPRRPRRMFRTPRRRTRKPGGRRAVPPWRTPAPTLPP